MRHAVRIEVLRLDAVGLDDERLAFESKYLPRDRAFAKLCSLAKGAAIVRQELA